MWISSFLTPPNEPCHAIWCWISLRHLLCWNAALHGETYDTGNQGDPFREKLQPFVWQGKNIPTVVENRQEKKSSKYGCISSRSFFFHGCECSSIENPGKPSKNWKKLAMKQSPRLGSYKIVEFGTIEAHEKRAPGCFLGIYRGWKMTPFCGNYIIITIK